MLQETLMRLDGLDVQSPLVICNEEHRFIAAEQLRQVGLEHPNILLEPEGRNTAPAIALAALHATREGEDPFLLVLAADHAIENVDAFIEAVQAGLPVAEAGKLVTFGIVPSNPETGYGYIRRGAAVGESAFEVQSFVEKPDQETAVGYLEDGDYFWNSGMFLFRASRFLDELKECRPDIYRACEAACSSLASDMDFIRIDREAFLACPAESIDYAVMEKTRSAVVIPMDASWSDLGSWQAMLAMNNKNEDANAIFGDVVEVDTRNSFLYSQSRLLTAVGLDNIVVVETKDAVLVADAGATQDVKKVVEILKQRERDEVDLHRQVYRPWGSYDSVDNGHRFQVKRISVKPGAKLSVQMHHHRAEHWIVVSGTARVTLDGEEQLLTENQSTYIPIGVVHSLENPGKVPLELIEVQTGSYLGEDDIVRFDDKYGRA